LHRGGSLSEATAAAVMLRRKKAVFMDEPLGAGDSSGPAIFLKRLRKRIFSVSLGRGQLPCRRADQLFFGHQQDRKRASACFPEPVFKELEEIKGPTYLWERYSEQLNAIYRKCPQLP